MEARRLLHYTDRSVKQIAAELGFSEVIAFGRFFRAEVGVTPAAFRQRGPDTRAVEATRAGKLAQTAGNLALRESRLRV